MVLFLSFHSLHLPSSGQLCCPQSVSFNWLLVHTLIHFHTAISALFCESYFPWISSRAGMSLCPCSFSRLSQLGPSPNAIKLKRPLCSLCFPPLAPHLAPFHGLPSPHLSLGIQTRPKKTKKRSGERNTVHSPQTPRSEISTVRVRASPGTVGTLMAPAPDAAFRSTAKRIAMKNSSASACSRPRSARSM